MTQLYIIQMRDLRYPDWEDAGDEPTTREQAEKWAAWYRRGVEGLYEYRVMPVDAREVCLYTDG